MDITAFAQTLFTNGPPKPRNSVDIQVDLGSNQPTAKELAQFLTHLFVEGMKLLYGNPDKVSLYELTDEEFVKLRKYMESIGFTVHLHVYPAHEKQEKLLEISSNDPQDLSYWVFTVTEYNVCYSIYFEYVGEME
jgi:hypothetical protein